MIDEPKTTETAETRKEAEANNKQHNEEHWDNVSFILRGKHRKDMLKLLKEPKTPTQIKEETKLHFNVVSRTILELEKKGLVVCLNPTQKLMRFYQITSKGGELLDGLGD